MESLSHANSRFALDLFSRINETNPSGNVFFSPLSISAALAMVLLGSRGNTEAQVLKTFHFDEVEDIHSRFRALTADINTRDSSCLLRIANRLFGEKSYSFLPDFLTNTQKLYGADLAAVDFLQAYGEARKEINQWVEEKTEGKIPDLLSEGSVNSMTKLVLVNAIYFKGNWAEKFEEANTVDMPFRLNKNERKTVKMMYQKKKFRFGYISDMKTRVLELPYEEREFSMVILLPDEIEDDSTGLQKLEKQLTYEKLQEWTCPEHLYSTDVHVHLPKFELEESYDLKSDLAAMGLSDIFDSAKADLSGMSGAHDLFLSKIVHKAFVEVNEEGTEAAAATAGIAMLCMIIEEDFNADHPFLFFIRHNPTQSMLFFGRYQKTSSRTAEFIQFCHGIEGQITFVWRHLFIDKGLSYLNKSNPFQTLARKLTKQVLNDEEEKLTYLGNKSKENFSNMEFGVILVIEKYEHFCKFRYFQ